MGAFLQRLLPGTPGDHARHMGCVVQQPGLHLVGDGANLADRMGEQVQAAADCDQAGTLRQGEVRKPSRSTV